MRLLPKDTAHGWTPYLWLIYVGPYIVFPFLAPRVLLAGSRALTLTVWALGLVSFLWLYFRSYRVDGAPRLRLIVALAALGAVLSPINPAALMFFVYASGFVGGAAPPRHAGIWIGGLTLAGVIIAAFNRWEPYLLISGIAIMTPLIGFVNLHYSETRRRDAALKLAQDEVARVATLAERERIAGELHDLLGHTLSVIVLKSELASKLVAQDPARAAHEMNEVERVSREALAEVRRAVHGFRSATLADELVRARAVLETAGINVTVRAAVERPSNPDIEHAVAMIMREAVTNVVRHSRATACRITVSEVDGCLHMQIDDDGVGREVVPGAGIESMRARARELGGTVVHGSAGNPAGAMSASPGFSPGVSFAVRVSIPLRVDR
jgi:two-component system, NarL family, sensor histidine kinase DesK